MKTSGRLILLAAIACPALRTFSPRLDTSARSAWPGQTVEVKPFSTN
jgi:hypothetical protein